MTFDYYFWFSQPPTILTKFDLFVGYLFLALFVVGMVLLLAKRFINHRTYAKLVRKFMFMDLTVGSLGLIWFAMRYESIPIFAKRFWTGGLLAILAVWILWILKYLFLNFFREKQEFEQEQLKSKYLPGKK